PSESSRPRRGGENCPMLRRAGFVVLAFLALASARAARADEPLPLVHPLYVHLPEAPEEDALRRAFTAAVGRYKLGPVEVVDAPAPGAPRCACRPTSFPLSPFIARSRRPARTGTRPPTRPRTRRARARTPTICGRRR